MTCIVLSGFGQWLYNWQTLIAGVVALGAAVLALRPVYGQLALMRGQNSAMLRSTISEMIARLDGDYAALNEFVKPIGVLSNEMAHNEERGLDPAEPKWIDQQNGNISRMLCEMRASFALARDFDAIESAKQELVARVTDLSECFSDIFQPNWEYLRPEEVNWTEEQSAKICAEARRAESQLDRTFRAVAPAIRALADAYKEQRAALVRRLREIDDMLLA